MSNEAEIAQKLRNTPTLGSYDVITGPKRDQCQFFEIFNFDKNFPIFFSRFWPKQMSNEPETAQKLKNTLFLGGLKKRLRTIFLKF